MVSETTRAPVTSDPPLVLDAPDSPAMIAILRDLAEQAGQPFDEDAYRQQVRVPKNGPPGEPVRRG